MVTILILFDEITESVIGKVALARFTEPALSN